MKWLILGIALIIWNYVISGQDIVFPDDEEISHISGNNPVVTDRIPVSVPGECPLNMLLYPGDPNTTAWICDCRPRFLYFPLNNTCHEAYKQGPCAPQHYVVLAKNEAVPICVKNPCLDDGLVPYNNTCYPLRTVGGPCAPSGVLGVNETNFDIECVPADIAPFIIITVPKRQCPVGSRRNALGMCREVL